jgi:hypothetical protein
MLAQIVIKRYGTEWVKPLDVFVDVKTDEVILQGGPPDPERSIDIRKEAFDLLRRALQTQALIAEIELNGSRRSMSAMYWQTGSGINALERIDGSISFTGGPPPTQIWLDGRTFFVDRVQFEQWVDRLTPHEEVAKRDASASENGQGSTPREENHVPETLRPTTSVQGQQSTRMVRKRTKTEMYTTWAKLAQKYHTSPDGKKRSLKQIAKLVAKDPQAEDPDTGKRPADTSVIRRLNQYHRGWADGGKTRQKRS